MMRFLRLLPTAPALAALLFANASGQQPKAELPSATQLDLQDGDTFVFLGDSITHQSLYSQYFETFFYTRYPERRIRFHNAGVSGDKAADALARFDDDVAAYKPKYVSILLGMNDGQYEPINGETLGTYQADMTKILDRITEIGAQPIVMSPTMFDHHQLSLRMKAPDEYRFSQKTFDGDYNSLLAYFGGWLREQAGQRGLPFVDQWGPMNDVTFHQRRTKPDFSLVADAIHPGGGGQFLMAFEMLDQFSPDRRNTGGVTLMKVNDHWVGGTGQTGTVSDVKVSDAQDHASFTYQARSLPWVVPTEALAPTDAESKWENNPPAPLGYQLTIAGHKLSSERLRFVGIAPGDYHVIIDGVVLSKRYTHRQLSMKIEIQADEITPQYQQALKVAKLNRERNDLAIRPMRDLWSRIKGLRRKLSPEEFEKVYPAEKAKVDELIAVAKDYEDRIYEAAQPVPRYYEIERIVE